ncbi:group III truncated hemoglobin [Daeguia caeni]|uniref:Group III truncated hemoglobin n=1 Tax=Daeguia caeni TaxID=439612 RepID=A0ABV9H653_9HYPH
MSTLPLTHQPAIDQQSIRTLVATFYGRARQDELLGPIFNSTVEDWDHHIAQISAFWSSIILKTGGYDGRPMPPHLRLNLANAHFDRWLDIFEKTARDIFPEEAARIFIDRARRIADSFEMAIATHAGRISTPRHIRRPL